MFNFFLFIYSPHQFTPLHIAAKAGHVDTVRCLVDKGANINIKDGNKVREQEYSAVSKLVLLVRVWLGMYFFKPGMQIIR